MSHLQINLSSSTLEFYEAVALSFSMRYCMHNGQIWLSDTQTYSSQGQQACLDFFYLGVGSTRYPTTSHRSLTILTRSTPIHADKSPFLNFVPQDVSGHFPKLSATASLNPQAAKHRVEQPMEPSPQQRSPAPYQSPLGNLCAPTASIGTSDKITKPCLKQQLPHTPLPMRQRHNTNSVRPKLPCIASQKSNRQFHWSTSKK